VTKRDRPPETLHNDCFALPAGIAWTPVSEALGLLRARLLPVVGREVLSAPLALGRILAVDAVARRANPPAANSAVDGYGFAAQSVGEGRNELRLADGRAAAGAPFEGEVPFGQALRILTGALLPKGVDTVVLDEEVTVFEERVTFARGVKSGMNTRKAGEDLAAGVVALPKGRRLAPQDLALLTAVGTGEVEVYLPLRVGVLSTGDEIVPADAAAGPAKTFDANRPMLLALARRWDCEAIDLGHVGDDRSALRARLERASETCDATLISGGASAGDEDHVSALLREEGALHSWRIAVKPGRPLALALWRDMPVFGLPGNPVAAFVCSLIFARPALGVLGGAGWHEPTGFTVPAGFEKRKKAGRREYLRARIDADGRAQVFPSEGSGRISGLSWAEGLVELGDDACLIAPGDPVRFLPFGSFGL
jgi:molybdopterin molybdotransferase